jgi:hypothetical protein
MEVFYTTKSSKIVAALRILLGVCSESALHKLHHFFLEG